MIDSILGGIDWGLMQRQLEERSAATIQKAYRGGIFRWKRRVKVRRKLAAVAIQTTIRGRVSRRLAAMLMEARHEHLASVRIQATARGKRARHRVAGLRAERERALDENIARFGAACTVQAGGRGMAARRVASARRASARRARARVAELEAEERGRAATLIQADGRRPSRARRRGGSGASRPRGGARGRGGGGARARAGGAARHL